MAIIKCKMCGGDMELSADKTFGTCEYCGCTMTLPKIDDEQRANIFNRGNHFRRSGEFDKALAVYERIVAEDDTDAEAHWCCALCRFGIEYVEDPASYEWLPTCHRASFDSFLEDVDYLAALEHSDGITRRQYQRDAAKIAEVQRGILATSQSTEPYDVFISYKELDDNGERTRDSLLAQEIYYQLTEHGWRVFFSRISLEDIPGTQYEPYIFAALNSAKVMITVGTSAENLNAVWVKNEWSRFLSMMRKDRSKLLIPCYRDMDPYDLPEPLAVLMSYDMGKLGFMQDLVRGIDKVLGKKPEAAPSPAPVPQQVVQTVVQSTNGVTAESLLKRGNLFLEDKDWSSADEYFDKVLDMDPENASAYLGKLMAEMKVCRIEDLGKLSEPFSDNGHYKKILRFGDEALKSKVAAYSKQIFERKELERKSRLYNEAAEALSWSETEEDFLAAAEMFKRLNGFRDSEQLAEQCRRRAAEVREEAERARKDSIYDSAESCGFQSVESNRQAIEILKTIPGWRDADEKIRIRGEKIAELEAAERKAEKQKKIAVAVFVLLVLAAIGLAEIISKASYKAAEELYAAEKYDEAASAFEALGNYKDSAKKKEAVKKEGAYTEGKKLLEEGNIAEAAMAFGKAGDYSDAKARSLEVWEEIAMRDSVNAGSTHTVGLKSDGTVVAVGKNNSGQCDVSGWTDIVAVSAEYLHTVGLKSDGTVVAVGKNYDGQCEVSDWSDIVAISAGYWHTVGLKSDGTVVAVGKNNSGQCEVSGWTDIVAISAGKGHTVGLKSGGTVVAVGEKDDGQCDVSDWSDIVAISAGYDYTVGLKSDGTVVAIGNDNHCQCDVSDWSDIVAISAGITHTVGLKSDGTVVTAGYDNHGQCDVSDWTDIKLPEKQA